MLGGTLAVLAGVVYFQFFRDSPTPAPELRTEPRSQAAGAVSANSATPGRTSAARRIGGRFRPRLGGEAADADVDPMTADVTLRTDLLERVRSIEPPQVERDIFNFGRPRRPDPAPPAPEVARRAQSRLQAEMKRPEAPAPAPATRRPRPPTAQPPKWKYFGLAGDPSSAAQRAFLLDGEEILVAEEGTLLRDRYLIQSIGADAITLLDRQAGQDFTIRLEVPR